MIDNLIEDLVNEFILTYQNSESRNSIAKDVNEWLIGIVEILCDVICHQLSLRHRDAKRIITKLKFEEVISLNENVQEASA